MKFQKLFPFGLYNSPKISIYLPFKKYFFLILRIITWSRLFEYPKYRLITDKKQSRITTIQEKIKKISSVISLCFQYKFSIVCKLRTSINKCIAEKSKQYK